MIEIHLEKAYEIGEEKPVQVLKLEDIKAKHLRGVPVSKGMEIGHFLDVAQAASNYPRTLFDMLSAADAMKVMEEVGKQLGGGLETTASA